MPQVGAYRVKARNTARKIRRKGYLMTLYAANPQTAQAWDPAYDPDTGTNFYALELERKQGRDDEGKFLETSKIMIGMSPLTFNPRMGDQVLVAGVLFTLSEVKPFRIGGVVIYIDAKMERG